MMSNAQPQKYYADLPATGTSSRSTTSSGGRNAGSGGPLCRIAARTMTTSGVWRIQLRPQGIPHPPLSAPPVWARYDEHV